MSDPLTTAIELGKKLFAAANAVRDADIKMLVADLQLQLAEAKHRMAAIIEENLSLKGDLARALQPAGDMQVGECGLYYKPNGDGPFCTACHDSTGKEIRVSAMPVYLHGTIKYRCNVCKAHYI